MILALLAACGGSSGGVSDAGGPCADHWGYSGRAPQHDEDCVGLTGCTELFPLTCGCQCGLCEGELCVGWICDDSCPPPPCPASKPAEGSPGCSGSYQPPLCDYLEQSCPCGPDIMWHCTCNGGWTCARDTHGCAPCADGGTDGGGDATAPDSAPPDASQE